MSGSNNDKGWTFVNDADLQHLSDDGSSGSSEFVTLDGKDAISYHHKSRSSSVESEDLEQVTADDRDEPRATSSRDSSPELLEIPSCDDVSLGDEAEGSTPEVVSPGNTHSETQDEPEISRQDEPEISQQDEPEMFDPELVNHETCEPEVLDKEVVSALTCAEGHGQVNSLTDQRSPDLTPSEPSPATDDDEAMTGSLESLRDLHSSGVCLSWEENQWFWDDEVIQPDGEEDEATEADISGDNSSMEFIPQPSDPASGSTSSIEQLNLSADLLSAEGVAGEGGNSQQEVTLPPLGITNLKMIEKTKLSDSESDFSDIVKIDNIPQDEIPSTSSATEPRRFFRAVDLMQVSASSSSSGNSNLSSRFHFIHPLPGNHRYVYPREEEEDVQSLPGDVDDRVESEISGVAPDDSDIDLSTISYDLDQLEMRGDVIRTYKHRPNSTLNTLLTMLALLSLFTTLGIGIGHYLGTTREVALRGQKGVRLQQIQDEYLQCLRHQDILEAQLTVTDEQKIAAVTAVWKQKYEEMIIENVELDHTLKLLQKQLQDGLNHAHLVQDGLHHAHHEVLDHQDEPKPFVNDIVKIQQLELAESEAKLDELMAEVTQEKAQLAELQAHLMHRHDAIINKETNLEKKKILLSEKEAESIKTTASLNDREMELAERMSAVDERAAELILKEEELQRREMKLEEEKARLSEVAKVKVTDALLTEDALMDNQEAEVLETYIRPPLERQGHVSNTDNIDEDASLQDLRHLQEQVNLLATENDDLRHQVALLRYSAYQQTDQQVSASTQMTRELKEQANDLAQENNDLKSVVGKLRYTEPKPYPAVDPSSADESVQSSLIGQELVSPESDPEDVLLELQPETLPDPQIAIQELPGDETAVLDEGSPADDVTQLPRDGEQDPVPSVWSYLNLLVPDVDLSDLHKVVSAEQIANLTQPLWTQIEFIQNATADVNFTATLSQKWEELRDLVGHENTDIAANKVRETVGDIKNIFRSEFMEFRRYVDSEEFRSRKETVTEGISSVVDKISNSTVVARYQEFVNKTKESVTKLSRKIKKTWHKVKNLTGDFLNKNKALNDFGDTVTKSMSNIGKAVDSGWKKAQKQLKKKGLISDQWGASGKKGSKRKGKVWEGKKLYNGKIPQQQHTTYHPNLDENNKRDLPEEGKKLLRKPDHRNKESSSEYDKYEEYWKQAEFEPDDFLQEGFFEGNNRQWHKHEKKARKLHGRLQRLNDDIFLAMDDDDVEDIYEDFEDLQEDVDDMEQPEQLMAWLTCQVRWWKSRLYRKHSNEDLVKGCGRHMMQWQLTALCRPCPDHGIKCNKRQKAANAGPFCHYYQTVILPRTNEKLPDDSDRCDGDLSQRKVLRVSLDSDQTSVEGEVHNQYGSLRYSLSLDEPDVEPAFSLNTTEEEPSTKWLFERAEARESHHHDGSWMFKRGAKRDFQRNKPWYYERAEDRADHRSDRFQHIHHSANKHYKHHNRGRN